MSFSLKKIGANYFYTIPSFDLSDMTVNAFTTRLGGVSQQPYESLNLAFHVGDIHENVVKNREIVFSSLGIRSKDIVCAQQVHGDCLQIITEKDLGKGAEDYVTALPEVDGLITNIPGIPLTTYYADCVPIYLLDPVQKAIALCHAGWKGTVLKIALKTINLMVEKFGSDPKNCLAAVGPSIGPCHYQVDLPVIDQFKNNFTDCHLILKNMNGGKASLNLWEANKLVLQEAGISSENITMAEICTYCHHQMFFSYRGEQGITGRMAAVLMLKG